MIKKLKIFTLLILLFSAITLHNSIASFFEACGISNEELKKIIYVLNNGNSKFIPHDIDEISNETFQQALYLLSFYKDNEGFPKEMIDVIGLDTIKQVNKFKYYTINYILDKYKKNGKKIKNELKGIINSHQDLLFILQNKDMRYEFYEKEEIDKLIKKVFMENILSTINIEFLKQKFSKSVQDAMILQQIRFRLYYKKTDNIKKIIDMIYNQNIKNKAIQINNFYKKINKQIEIEVKLKNGKKKKKYKNLSKEQINAVCKQYIGQDEYIDLICIKNNKNDIQYLENILKNNLNPIFLPSQWLKSRIYYVREKINNKQEELDESVYDIIANSGKLNNNDYYTQQFLSGLTAYIRNDYENAILHFSKCAKIAKISDYSSKAHYWLGLSYKKNNQLDLSKNAFKKAKRHIFTMYGQLASNELFEDPEDNIEKYIKSFKENTKILCNDVNFVLGYLQQYNSTKNKLSEILYNYINDENKEKEKIFNVLCVIKNDFQDQYSTALSVYSIKYDVIHQNITFPTSNYENDSLINAVIKKETNFKTTSLSNKGAIGIMQIMPSTGKVLAQNMGLKYDYKKLLQDEEYNINMGKYYIEKLLTRYDDNKLLALAAYNAGATNVEKWIIKNGDPRNMNSHNEIVEWIEKIPFQQTREYVVKILGFEMVYDVINKMNGKSKNN